MRVLIAGLAVMALSGSGAFAQTPQASPSAAPVCTGAPVIPAQYAAWSAKTPLGSARDVAGLGAAQIPVGKAVTAQLLPTPDVKFAAQSERPGGSVSKSGLFGFKVTTAGTYYVALSGPPWIDVMKVGATAGLESVAHGHGPDCSGIRKIVDFKLEPGDYLIQVAGSAQAELGVMVGKRP